MFRIFTRKKIKEDKAVNVFVNSIIIMVEKGFPNVADIINNDTDFISSPNIKQQDDEKFLLIVFAANIKLLNQSFDSFQEIRITDKIYRKLGIALGVELDAVKKLIGEYQHFMSRVNHPSKNVLYSMSKGVFYKYNLNKFQFEFFKCKNTPNPIFLKRLDEIMQNFIWDWDSFREKHRITE